MPGSPCHAAARWRAAAPLRQRGFAWPRLFAAAGVALGAAVVGALTVWAFLAYTHPDRVLDFAAFLQMCGIPLAR
ncbi:MAG TPA: hypothetical protein VN324_13385 [Quisquiliibacterium sp.]|nr:hypothetical protein [Quisquiliibacterium sp.]